MAIIKSSLKFFETSVKANKYRAELRAEPVSFQVGNKSSANNNADPEE